MVKNVIQRIENRKRGKGWKRKAVREKIEFSFNFRLGYRVCGSKEEVMKQIRSKKDFVLASNVTKLDLRGKYL